MLVNVETFFLDTLVNAQAVQLLDAVEQDETTGCCPKVDDQDAKRLSAEEPPTASVECTVRGREQTCHQRAKDTADAVY